MKILITGGAGMVGTTLVHRLQQLKIHDFLVVDNLLYETDYLMNVPFKRGDVSDPAFMIPLLDNYEPDAVIHLAGIVGDAACSLRPIESYNVNIKSIKLLADYYKGRIIWPSSCSVYGLNDEIATEESPVTPLSLYAQMKVNGEQLLIDKNAFIPRLGTLHGVGGRFRSDLVVNLLTIRALIEGKIQVFGGGQYRPLLHVEDLADTIVRHLASTRKGVFNLAEGNYKILDIAQEVQRQLPNTQLEITPTSFEDSRNYKVSIEKAQKAWGFKPTLGINYTIKSIIDLYNEGRIKDFANMKYSNVLGLQFHNK